MSDIQFRFIGWCNEVEANGKKHDKVWCAFNLHNKFYAAWGARGKALSFKEYGYGWPAESEQTTVMNKKKKKYVSVENDAFLLFSVFPDFQDQLEKRFTYCVLANKIK